MRSIILLFAISFFSFSLFSQEILPTPTSDRLASFSEKQKMETHPLIENLEFKSVGPVRMSGRVTDVEGNPGNNNEF